MLLAPLLAAAVSASASGWNVEAAAGAQDVQVLAALAEEVAGEMKEEAAKTASETLQLPTTAAAPPGAVALDLPLRLTSERMVPPEDKRPDGSIGTIRLWVKDKKTVASDRAGIRLRIDGVLVKIGFDVKPVDHPERFLGYGRIEHAYDMAFLRRLHGYTIDRSGRYVWDEDNDDPHGHRPVIPTEKGREMDAFLQKGIELWMDRALAVMIVNLEASFLDSQR